MEPCYLTPASTSRLNTVHFQTLRRVFGIKSSYYHRVIQPSDAPCSNEHLARLANQYTSVPTPSQAVSCRRLKLLDHILRHPDSHEFTATFNQARAYRTVRGKNRRGRPQVHWAEVAMTEAQIRLRHQDTDSVPPLADIGNQYWMTPSTRVVKEVHHSRHVPWMDNTLILRRVNPVAQDRNSWKRFLAQPRQVASA